MNGGEESNRERKHKSKGGNYERKDQGREVRQSVYIFRVQQCTAVVALVLWYMVCLLLLLQALSGLLYTAGNESTP